MSWTNVWLFFIFGALLGNGYLLMGCLISLQALVWLISQ